MPVSFTRVLVLTLQALPCVLAGFGRPLEPAEPVLSDIESELADHANTPTETESAPSAHPKTLCANNVYRVLAYDCDRAASSSSTPVSTTAQITAASSSSVETCGAADAACNSCAVAISFATYCEDLVSSASLDAGYVVDCLCYEADTGNNNSLIWAPNYYDNAIGACPVWASSADSSEVSDFKSYTSLCSYWQNYYNVSSIDTGTFQLAIATATPGATPSGSAQASTGSSASTSMASPTSGTSGACRIVHDQKLLQAILVAALFNLIF